MSEPKPLPDDPDVPDEALPPREKAMGFWEHLEELRGTIIKSVAVFTIFAGLIGYFIKEFHHVMVGPLLEVQAAHPEIPFEKLGTNKITEVFSMVIQMCVLGGLVLAAPFILFFIGQFVSPALTRKELKAVLPMCIAALILFLLGAAFGFFLLLPTTIETAIQLHEMFELDARWTVNDYYTTLSWLVLGVGASFEFPLLIILMVWMGIMTTAFLRKYRRHSIVVILIIAALITPSSDPFTLMTFAVPLYVLFEAAIIVGARIEKTRERRLIG